VSVPAREVPIEPVIDPTSLPAGWALALPQPAEPDILAPSARTPAVRPQADGASRPRRRARRGLHPTFLVFASIVIVALVIGVVAINALLAQTAFAVHTLQSRVTELSEQHDVLATDAARLSSPSRITSWAERAHMVAPDDVIILRVPRFGRVSPETP
jgi:cell division protein FtsL